jgi:hypothetical protein
MTAANVSEEIREKFPLHSSVWENDYRSLERDLAQVCQYLFVLNIVIVYLLKRRTSLNRKLATLFPYSRQTNIGHPSLRALRIGGSRDLAYVQGIKGVHVSVVGKSVHIMYTKFSLRQTVVML